jgi:protein-L-isoaspartate(D-aspartate) O-methyltransferase
MQVQPARPRCPQVSGSPANGGDLPDGGAGPPDDEVSRAERDGMVTRQIGSRGDNDPAVLSAMRQVPRHLFVPPALRVSAYADYPLPIGHGQTISQPFIVALMTELARPAPTDRVLEVGTGSGYQAAVLSRLVSHVFSLEIDENLGRQAAERLAGLGYVNVTVLKADGYEGWVSEAPFDIVIVTAAPPSVPQALVDQLAPGGRLVIPVGPHDAQELSVIEKQAGGGTSTRTILPVVFVPMVHTTLIGGREEESEDGGNNR